MDTSKKHMTTAKGAKDYLSKNEIPQLFECLMTGLMYNRPDDYIGYLQECLEKIKTQGISVVRWDMFLEAKKAPLPPIEALPKEDFRPEPLPEIGSYHLKIPSDATIILLQAGPGMDKKNISIQLGEAYSDFIVVHLGELLRQRALAEHEDSDSKWCAVFDKINKGELAPREFVLDTLINALNEHQDQSKFIITGYPRTLEERQDFERFMSIGRLKFMVLVDSDESVCQRKATSKGNYPSYSDNAAAYFQTKLSAYKSNTLAVCKYFDDMGKLKLIDGNADPDYYLKLIKHLIEKEIYGRTDETIFEENVASNGEASREVSKLSTEERQGSTVIEIPELTGVPKETERSSELAHVKLVLLLGGPGCGKSAVAAQLQQRMGEAVQHFNMNDELREQVINAGGNDTLAELIMDNNVIPESYFWNADAVRNILETKTEQGKSIILLEGYPKSKEELCHLNTQIGTVDKVILLDSEEEVLTNRLQQRYEKSQSDEDSPDNAKARIVFFKRNGLSICRYYDERSRLHIVSSDRDLDSIVEDVQNILLADSSSSLTIDETEAAIKIQASIRGHLTRKHLNESTTEGADESKIVAETEEKQKMLVENIDEENLVIEESKEEIVEDTAEKTDDVNEEGVENVEETIEPEHAFMLGDKGVRTSSQLKVRDANVILLIGGPGSGKKTIGDHLVIKYAVPCIHVDQIIANIIANDGDNAESLKSYVETNEPNEDVIKLIRQEIANSMDTNPNIIISGFPRTTDQYEAFLADISDVSCIIHLDVDTETMKSRLTEDENSTDNHDQEIDVRIEQYSATFPDLAEHLISSTGNKYLKIDCTKSVEEIVNEVSGKLDDLNIVKTHEEEEEEQHPQEDGKEDVDEAADGVVAEEADVEVDETEAPNQEEEQEKHEDKPAEE